MIAVQLRLEAEPVVQGVARQVARLDLQTDTARALIAPPRREARDDSPGEPRTPPAGIGDHRLVAQEAIADRTVGERRQTAVYPQSGEGGRQYPRAHDMTVNTELRGGGPAERRPRRH